jgi:hypothetical protein
MECKIAYLSFTLLKTNILNRFRWVTCQLDVLRKCLKVDTLRKTLRSLPKSLDETYDRILSNIDKIYRDDAQKILQWLTFSARPVTLAEVAEVLAVDVENCCLLHCDQRLANPRDILTICSCLVTTSGSGLRSDNDGINSTGGFDRLLRPF